MHLRRPQILCLATVLILTTELLLACSSGSAQSLAAFAENPFNGRARGPISIRNSRPYNLLFLQFLPESPDPLPRGVDDFSLQLDVINMQLIPGASNGVRVVEDNETQRLLVGWTRGLDGKSEIGFHLPLLYRNGGILDELMNLWHRAIGITGSRDGPDRRGRNPEFRSIMGFTDASGNVLLRSGNGLGLGDASITFKRALFANPRSALSARLGLKLPTGNPGLILGSGGVDGGVALDGRYNVGRDIILYGSYGGVWMSKATRIPNPSRFMTQYLVGGEYRANGRDSWILQFDGNSQPLRTGHRFVDRENTTATFGYKRALDRRLLLTASVSENGDITDYNNPFFGGIGPDFTASLKLEWVR
jgi:hypothetical protein